ncbi:MAG TPA: membrane protein insertion efficiency factor YidD [Hyphomicrobiaceae bacterium]|nr:membrane protein insertion efficiency factor YidD [Hyphomicrobiaceae bacterium]
MPPAGSASPGRRLAAGIAKLPIHVYRYTLKPLIGYECRHLPSCSAYGLDAIERNGAWRGLWLTVSRIWRCSPWGTSGHDEAPDIRAERHLLAPWRYGRWTRAAIARQRNCNEQARETSVSD